MLNTGFSAHCAAEDKFHLRNLTRAFIRPFHEPPFQLSTFFFTEPNFLTHICKRTLSNVHNISHLGAGSALVAGGVSLTMPKIQLRMTTGGTLYQGVFIKGGRKKPMIYTKTNIEKARKESLRQW